MKQRLDQALVARGLVATRSQAESWIRLGKVFVDGQQAGKAGAMVDERQRVELRASEQYVSRAGLKLASAARQLGIDFTDKVVLDVGSSTGGFTDFALQHGARKIIAVDVGTEQLHPTLRENPRVALYEQIDIRAVSFAEPMSSPSPRPQSPPSDHLPHVSLIERPDIILADVSFISLRDILPHLAMLSSPQTLIIAMVKPQFEAGHSNLKHKGVIKNDHMRREILKEFEEWAMHDFVVLAKADSEVAGARGNLERFYKLRAIRAGR